MLLNEVFSDHPSTRWRARRELPTTLLAYLVVLVLAVALALGVNSLAS